MQVRSLRSSKVRLQYGGGGGKRVRDSKLGSSIERVVYYSKPISKFKSVLTASEQKVYKEQTVVFYRQ